MEPFVVESAPHIRTTDDIPRIMWDVVVALVPALVAAAYFFGWYALVVTAVSAATAVATEALIQRLTHHPITVSDGSAVVTGVLLAYVIPPDAPLYVPIVGSFFAIAIAKQCFGGLGCNIWNPALAGRAFLHFAFPAIFNAGAWNILARDHRWTGALYRTVDAVSQATPLKTIQTCAREVADPASWKGLFHGAAIPFNGMNLQLPSLWKMFLGEKPGCLGEVSGLALVVGGLYLLLRKRIKWHIPVLYAGTVFALTSILPPAEGRDWFPGPLVGLYHLLAGGLLLGALFMATDMVTSPVTTKGQVIFAVGCGLLTSLIRLFGGYPEGVCFSILLMNTAVPLIDRYTQPRPFGAR